MSVMRISTLRFCALPAGVLLVATGRSGPYHQSNINKLDEHRARRFSYLPNQGNESGCQFDISGKLNFVKIGACGQFCSVVT